MSCEPNISCAQPPDLGIDSFKSANFLPTSADVLTAVMSASDNPLTVSA